MIVTGHDSAVFLVLSLLQGARGFFIFAP